MRLSLFARMALILLLGLLAAQATSLWLHWDERTSLVAQTRGQYFLDQVAETVRMLDAESRMRRQATMTVLQSSGLNVSLIDADQTFRHTPRPAAQASIAERLGQAYEIRVPGGMGRGRMMGLGAGKGQGQGRGQGLGLGLGPGRGAGMRMDGMTPDEAGYAMDIRLTDGQWIRIATSRGTETPALPTDFFTHLIVSLLIIAGVVMFAVRQATRPLQQLAGAADALGNDLNAPPLAENGPQEARQAAQAFNRMQQRLRRLIDERSRALAAVSHDLRTPLTRLRLRAELVDDEALREQMNADLDAMAAMIDGTLDYFRGLREDEPLQPIDINALLLSLVDDATLSGRRIDIDGAAHAPFPGRLNALRRALQNLIDNALRHGGDGDIRLRLQDNATLLQINVEDSGPGIPPTELARIIEPYQRLDTSRSSGASGGLGLGLSIANDVAHRHGGELRLANRPTGGLAASLLLPRQNS